MRKFLLLFMGIVFFAAQAMAQRTITGKVTDDKGNPLANVSVLVKGTTTGTTTKTDGTYSLVLPANAKTLVFSSVDMTAQEAAITASSSISVTLSSANKNLDEVIVVAYGTVKKEALTGSVGRIKAEDIKARPLNNITAAIEGAVPGVITTSANGQPGSGVAIRVRGFGSINATSEPLFVVDGVPYINNSSNINPDDVESITLLKDAASTALYGSRAGNGVVIITTKKGKKGRNGVSMRLMQGFASRGLAEYERLDAFQYYPIMWEGYRNSLVYPVSGAAISLDSANRVASGLTTRTSTQGLLAYNPFFVANNAIVGTDGKLNPAASVLKYPDDVDWTKDLMRNGSRKDYSVNFNGGADKSDYFMSMNYVREDGYTIKTNFEKFSARLNVNVQPKTWLKAGLNISGNYSVANTAADGGSTNFVNPFFFSRNVGPIYPVFSHNMTTGQYALDANGNRVWDLGNFGTSAFGIANGIPNRPTGGFAGRQALAETTLNEPLFKRSVASARSYVDILFLKDFKFTSNVAVDLQTQYNSSYENTLVGDGAPAGRSQKQSLSSYGATISQLLNYSKKFKGHSVDVLAGHESVNQLETDVNGFKQGQTALGITDLGNFTTINSVGSSTDKYRIESFFSRLSYDYRSKYFLSGSIRRDGNSRFSKPSRWGTFWSVGGGWNLDKESFMNNVKWIDLLKLRSSYGVVGVADGIGFYAYQGLYGFNNNANEPGITQSQTSVFNGDLTWEVNKQFDIGIDFAIFKNRVSGSFEYYNRKSSKLLFAVPTALSSGLLSLTKNTANMYNKGLELQLSVDIVKTKNFTWNAGVNVSTVTNKITKMPEGIPEFVSGTKKFSVGHSIFDYWLRTYYGVDPADGAALYKPISGATASTLRTVANKNGGTDVVTTSISQAVFEYQGGTIPDYYGSFTNSFTFRQITLSGLFIFQKGGRTFDGLYQSLMSVNNIGGAAHIDILNRWQKPGDITDVPRVDNGRATDFNATSSRWLVDASFFNIRSISLSYNLPQSLVSKFKITNAQFFVTGENVAFFSKRKGMNNQQAFSGVTSNAYPPARVVTAGVTLNF